MKRRLPAILLGLAVTLFVATELLRPQPLDWRVSFEHDDRRPYGSLVLYDLLPDLLGGAAVTPVEQPPYLFLADSSRTGTTYLFVTHHFEPDEDEAARLYRHAARGNTVFVAARVVAGPLADTLGLLSSLDFGPIGSDAPEDSALHLVNPALSRPGGYRFEDEIAYGYFGEVDTARTTVLGLARDSLVNFVRVDVGEGAFYLLAAPLALTNYNLLGGDGAAYAAAVFSYLPAQPAFWDAYAKPLRNVDATPLRYVLEHDALRWAYFTALLGAVLFVLFRGRRWQRAIPVVAPPPNTTLRFVRTVGRLYHEHGDDRDLVEKKARFFLDRLRSALHEPALDFAPEHRDRVARQLDVDRAEVDALFDRYLALRAARHVTARDLLDLDHRTADFYRRLA